MQVYCVLSDERVYHSKSPAIFSAVLKRLGINATYIPFKVKPGQIGQAMQSLRVLNIAGANITVPYKEVVVPHLDVLSEGANIIGSVNTVVRKDDMLKGYNTNAIGFMDALNDAGFDTDGKSALVFGTGGAAKSVVFMLNWLRTSTIFVAGRDMGKVQQVVDRLGGEAVSLSAFPDQPFSVNIVVNATSVSSADESPELAGLVEGIELEGCELVVDLNYDQRQNIWQDLARRNNVRFMDGLSPLAYQSRRTLALWTGIQVPPEEFITVLDEI